MPNLLELCHPLQPLLNKNTNFNWTNELECYLQHIKKVANAKENTL